VTTEPLRNAFCPSKSRCFRIIPANCYATGLHSAVSKMRMISSCFSAAPVLKKDSHLQWILCTSYCSGWLSPVWPRPHELTETYLYTQPSPSTWQPLWERINQFCGNPGLLFMMQVVHLHVSRWSVCLHIDSSC